LSNVVVIDELIYRQEGQPGSSKSPPEIAREAGISRRSVQRIMKHVLLEKYRTWTTKVNSRFILRHPEYWQRYCTAL